MTASTSNPRKRTANQSGAGSGSAMEGPSNKRKKVDMGHSAADTPPPQRGKATNNSSTNQQQQQSASGVMPEESRIAVDLNTFPMETLQKYLTHYDLVPRMYPSPTSSYNPPLPSHLLNPPPPPPPPIHRTPSPHLNSVTPANRPRRDPKSRAPNGNSRRSSRLAEEEFNRDVYAGVKDPRGNPILHDLVDAQKTLAQIASNHWEKTSLKEADVIESFTWAVRNKDRLLRI
ncbi:hypothetical protein FRC02_010004 [Tulasnella sp. 418]|nr:hypothetical protein FRC02_010004 [Tulasnella sp. 418]